eukprot:TRINITY_DN1170_c0_g2_i1.p1 TRINITY_DN1170_c0_g2~~TRINITY_DN1170_c0_g2_i1.p1  ORF type:complete len:645 (-),score=265.53 TRINITY_DN1170_c0_g2_i1:136-2070(-)
MFPQHIWSPPADCLFEKSYQTSIILNNGNYKLNFYLQDATYFPSIKRKINIDIQDSEKQINFQTDLQRAQSATTNFTVNTTGTTIGTTLYISIKNTATLGREKMILSGSISKTSNLESLKSTEKMNQINNSNSNNSNNNNNNNFSTYLSQSSNKNKETEIKEKSIIKNIRKKIKAKKNANKDNDANNDSDGSSSSSSESDNDNNSKNSSNNNDMNNYNNLSDSQSNEIENIYEEKQTVIYTADYKIERNKDQKHEITLTEPGNYIISIKKRDLLPSGLGLDCEATIIQNEENKQLRKLQCKNLGVGDSKKEWLEQFTTANENGLCSLVLQIKCIGLAFKGKLQLRVTITRYPINMIQIATSSSSSSSISAQSSNNIQTKSSSDNSILAVHAARKGSIYWSCDGESVSGSKAREFIIEPEVSGNFYIVVENTDSFANHGRFIECKVIFENKENKMLDDWISGKIGGGAEIPKKWMTPEIYISSKDTKLRIVISSQCKIPIRFSIRCSKMPELTIEEKSKQLQSGLGRNLFFGFGVFALIATICSILLFLLSFPLFNFNLFGTKLQFKLQELFAILFGYWLIKNKEMIQEKIIEIKQNFKNRQRFMDQLKDGSTLEKLQLLKQHKIENERIKKERWEVQKLQTKHE